MKSLAFKSALLVAMAMGPTCFAADLVLRERATQNGSIVRLGDIADIGASSTAELKSLASTPLLPAPAKGTQQFLTIAQVRDLLQARGVQLDALSIQGAPIVEIGSAKIDAAPVKTPETDKVNEEDLHLLVQQAIGRHVQSESMSGQWRVEVSLTASQLAEVAELGAKMVAHSTQPLRTGNRRFVLGDSTGREELAVFAKLTQIQPVVVVLRRIDRGQIVRAADVEIRQREGNLPDDSLANLDQVIGQEAQRTLIPESILQASHIRAPWQVLRGETVHVFVRTGGIAVRTRALAKENGAMGDLIVVETLGDKQKLNVSVSGPSEVTVHATGGQTTDYASLQREQHRR